MYTSAGVEGWTPTGLTEHPAPSYLPLATPHTWESCGCLRGVNSAQISLQQIEPLHAICFNLAFLRCRTHIQ